MEHIKYFYTYETHVKQRWVGKPIIDVLTAEFRTRSYDYYVDAITHGIVTVGHVNVCIDYKLKNLDIIRHTVHMHEPISPEIEIIKEEDDFVVVNKPSGIPCHPTGGYCEYSVTKTLFKDSIVGCVNRLDMPVSGVLIITKKNYNDAHQSLKDAEKMYVAKVKGYFPDEATVNEPTGLIGARVYGVTANGKESVTTFKRLSYIDGYSLVECRPITGRTHQIRIHIQHLGFPILNDILYGGVEIPEVKPILINGCDEDVSMFEDSEKYEKIIKHCKGINNRAFIIKDSFICLHAWKYTFKGITYESKLPLWAVF